MLRENFTLTYVGRYLSNIDMEGLSKLDFGFSLSSTNSNTYIKTDTAV